MTQQPDSTTPLFLDVDTGVDDALAIVFAVRSRARLVGVSTVAGNVPIDHVTRNSLSVLSWVGAESVPVHRGASRPLALPYYDAAHVHGSNGLGGAEFGGSRAPEARLNGMQAILDAADLYQGQLVLVALGPITNVAMALNIRPRLVEQVRRLVIMGGAFRTGGNVTQDAEYNVYADPHAAQQVIDGGWSELVVVGLDVTHLATVTRSQWEGLEEGGSRTAELLRRVTERTFTERGMDGIYLHDPLAVAVALDDSLVETESHAVKVELADDELRGKVTLAGKGSARVALGIDAARFERWFAELLELPARSTEETPDRVE